MRSLYEYIGKPPWSHMALGLGSFRTCCCRLFQSPVMARSIWNDHPSRTVIDPPPDVIFDSQLNENISTSATIIFLHGLGDTASGWVPFAQSIQLRHPSWRMVLPTAETNPVTLNGGMPMTSWHDIQSFNGLDQPTTAANFNGLENSYHRITNILDREIKYINNKNHRIVLAGFSQGAALALYTGLQYNKPLAGIMCLSGYLPTNNLKTILKNRQTPVWQGHGENDQVVNVRYAQRANKQMTDEGIDATLKTYRNLGHATCAEEEHDIVQFLEKVLPDRKNA